MNELFLKIINMSISASWLVLAVLILRFALKKAPKWVNVLLWGIVAVRLICPFSFESALSLIPSAETIPLLMVGVVSMPMFSGMVSALGIRLNALSKENGHINLTATIPQSRTLTHLGAFFRTNLRINTARTSQLADMLILMIFKKSSFIANLLS